MRDGGLAVLCRQSDLEDTELVLLHLMRVAVPVVWQLVSPWSNADRIVKTH